MNQVDALLLLLLAPFALRGYWRGFCREVFGLVGLVGGAAAAGTWSLPVADVLVQRQLLPVAAARPVAFAVVFLGVVVTANLLGLVADRLVRAILLGGLNRIAGAAFGCAKGAAFAAVLLLVAHRLLPSRDVQEMIARSTLGGPLVRVAENLLRGQLGAAPQHA